ncbi:unnamed protein product [Arabidopsis thaliana]|uniref:Uncharacterized protein n=2 Tax=Arabidopsis thaliana TaxID=3702 RepID=A8MQQ5_ARATH|nr:uncharacterized protein AT2G27160 [Arabidopsis thaliana]AEC07947.1 hypothetical protein AT2G27160 [Arabidopsis thaliana]VYS53654.1 unnamed protein product [Arabidopsis thaliana]|eukprot:NP_001077967.1 hypothetical protein AT2G27160 [Arabidopsis thaliana]
MVHVFPIGQILLVQIADIAKQREISGRGFCLLEVWIALSCNQHGDMFPSRLLKVNQFCFVIIVGTRKDVPEGIGRRKGIAIYLSLKQSVFGIMLATNMLTVVRARMIVEAVNILTVEWLMLSLTENWTRLEN